MRKGLSALALNACLAAFASGGHDFSTYIRGDVNGDGILSLADAVTLQGYLFQGTAEPSCFAAADTTVDGCLDIADSVMIIRVVALGDASAIPSSMEEPALVDCQVALTGAPSVDTGEVLYLEEVARGGAEITVPLRISAGTQSLYAWRCTVEYPADMLEFVRADFALPEGAADGPFVGEAAAGVPGAVGLAACYDLLLFPTGALFVEPGSKLADLVFRPMGTPVGRAELAIGGDYGSAELSFGPIEVDGMVPAAVFPAVYPGAVLFDTASPAAPSGLRAQGGAGGVQLSWTNGGTYDAMVVERDGQTVATLAGSATGYIDAPSSGLFGYRVRGRQGSKSSPASFAAVAAWNLPPPTSINISAPDLFSSVLTWENVAAYSAVRIYRDGVAIADLPGVATTYADNDRERIVAVYHLCGRSGEGRSMRVGTFWEPCNDVGENGVQNLACRFTGPGDLLVTWDAAPDGADGYEVRRDGELVASLDTAARQFVDHPPFAARTLVYDVLTRKAGAVPAIRVCRIPFMPGNSVGHLSARLAEDLSVITFSWANRAPYLAIVTAIDGTAGPVLPGAAIAFSYPLQGDLSEGITFSFHAIGADFRTSAEELTIRRSQRPFLRGDTNWDGRVSVADALYSRRYLFNGSLPPPCMTAADADDNGVLDIADPIHTLTMLFLGDVLLPEPYPIPGFDVTTDDLSCDAGEIIPGEFSEDIIRVGEVEAAPGDTVWIPVYVTNSVPIEAYQLVVQYDPTAFTPFVGGANDDEPVLDFSGTAYDLIYDEPPLFSALYPVSGEGYLVVGVMGDIIDDRPIPPGEDQIMVWIGGQVAAGAATGQTIELTPINGPGNEGVGVHRMLNEITWKGDSRYVSFFPQTRKGYVHVKDNPLGMDFLRGDVNQDGEINIADAVFVLSYLFNSGRPPACPDSADANDDGALNLADGIATLLYLFMVPDEEPSSFRLVGRCGRDARPDTLGVCVTSGCRK